MKRILGMFIVVVMVLGILPATAFAETFDKENFVGLVLTVADDTYTVELYKGITSQKTQMTPVYTEGNAYYFKVTSAGSYCYIVKSGSADHYTVRQNFNLTAEDIQTKTVWDITPPVRSTAGWDPTEVWYYSDAVMENAFPSSPELWPAYAELLKVPALTKPRTDHQMTTQEEMMDYIHELDGEEDDLYVLSLGQSGGPTGKQLDIPVVFFTKTDLSGAKTWEEAAALLRNNGKLTVMYQAQIHGNEPAAGEAALGMLKAFDGSYGAGLLDNMNICVLPRLNVYGASKASRYVYVGGKDADPNRDFVGLESQEIMLRTQLFLALEPEVSLDNHEYQVRITNTNVDMHDVKLNAVYTTKSTEAFREMSLTLANQAFKRAEENGLGYAWYDDCINGYNASVGTTNAAMRGCLSYLTETNGIMGGNQQLERRMMSHISVVTGILDYVNANTATVQKVVDDQRADIVLRGKTYEESDIIVLQTGSTDRPDLYIAGRQVSASTGKITNKTNTAKSFDVAKKSRPAPTAYVIPAGEPWAETVVENMRLNGVTCTKLPEGVVLQLQQYTGTTTEAALTEEKAVTFTHGAYVMTMAQENSYILAVRMEPDMSDGSSNMVTFAQEGIIEAVNGAFPIYRYVRDLNEEDFVDYRMAPAAPTGLTATGVTAVGGTGKIVGLDAGKAYEYRAENETEYTAVAAGSTEIANLPLGKYLVRYPAAGAELPSADAEITVGYALEAYAVYLDSAQGDDENDGYTEAMANKTLAQAQKQLDKLLAYAPAGTTGVIRILGTYVIETSKESYTLQTHTYPLLITGDKLKYTNTSTAGRGRYLRMGGETTFDNITVETGSAHKDYFLCGEGHKLTIGKNVTSLPGDPTVTKPVCYFSIAGGTGQYSNNQYVDTTDVTIHSGHWRYVYAGGYVSSVEKEARVVMTGGSVASVYMTHNGHHHGNIYVELENVTIRDDVLYCGNYQKNNVAGDVTMVLKEGVAVANVYAGSRTAGNVDGTVTIVADGVDLTKTTLYGKAKNTTGTIGGLALVLNQGQLSQAVNPFVTRDGVSVKLGCDQTESFTLPYDITLDLNGCNVAAVDTAGHTLHVFDSKTDDYVGDDYGTIPADASYAAAENYLAVAENGKVSFHRYTLQIRRVTLKNSMVGLSYQCLIAGDEKVKSQVAEFGVAMRVGEPVTGAQIREDTENRIHVVRDGSGWRTGSQGQRLTSVAVKDIMKPGESNESNAQGAETKVYGSAYMLLKDGTYILGDAEGRSLREVAELADGIYDTLNETQIQAFRTLYTTFQPVMESWNLPNLKA